MAAFLTGISLGLSVSAAFIVLAIVVSGRRSRHPDEDEIDAACVGAVEGDLRSFFRPDEPQ